MALGIIAVWRAGSFLELSVVLGMGSRAVCVLGTRSTTELAGM